MLVGVCGVWGVLAPCGVLGVCGVDPPPSRLRADSSLAFAPSSPALAVTSCCICDRFVVALAFLFLIICINSCVFFSSASFSSEYLSLASSFVYFAFFTLPSECCFLLLSASANLRSKDADDGRNTPTSEYLSNLSCTEDFFGVPKGDEDALVFPKSISKAAPFFGVAWPVDGASSLFPSFPSTFPSFPSALTSFTSFPFACASSFFSPSLSSPDCDGEALLAGACGAFFSCVLGDADGGGLVGALESEGG